MLILGMILKFVLLVILVLVSVAFFTLLERKILGYTQSRKGPGKVGFMGLFQPFTDAVKLFSKEQLNINFMNISLYVASPSLALILILLGWSTIPSEVGLLNLSSSGLIMMCILSAGVYSSIFAGWSSNSKYSLLGAVRSAAQTVSYEVSLVIIFLAFVMVAGSYNFNYLSRLQEFSPLLLVAAPMAGVWFVSSLAETNRTPFDFSEGESELVSGFNTEYSGGGFALFFMAEYSSILFMSAVFCVVFLSGNLANTLFYVGWVLVGYFFILTRTTLPRLRYDKLMNLAWKSFLSCSLLYLTFFTGLAALLFSFFF